MKGMFESGSVRDDLIYLLQLEREISTLQGRRVEIPMHCIKTYCFLVEKFVGTTTVASLSRTEEALMSYNLQLREINTLA